MNLYQDKLKELLINSTLTTGFYEPSSFVKTSDHMAVMLDGLPIYLAGESDCAISEAEAKQIARNGLFKLGLEKIGLFGELSYGVVAGSSIKWKEKHSAIVRSESGCFEDGKGMGKLVGINLTESEPLAVLMCVNDCLAKILDPNCPTLDNGSSLSFLAKNH